MGLHLVSDMERLISDGAWALRSTFGAGLQVPRRFRSWGGEAGEAF